MPNIDSAKKRARQTAKRTAVNHARKSRVRNFTRKVEEALAAGDKDAALKALQAAEPELMRGASKGVIHRNAAQRKVSRLAKRAAKLQGK
jgi:small subunit ribosomal protein S20